MAETAAETCPMVAIFTECQETSLSHDRLLASLFDLYNKVPFALFARNFFELCRFSLLSAERTPQRERTVDFIVRAVVHIGTNAPEREDGHPRNLLLLKMLLFCVKYHECVNHAPRFRCTQLIYKILVAMGPETCVTSEIFDLVQRVLLRRARDVKPMIRIQAVLGLGRLQNPLDRKCPIINKLMWLARHDASPEVRKTALNATFLTTFTLGVIVERCRDVSDSVRKAAYSILAQRVVVKPLSIAKRITILQDGLTDPSTDVRKAAEALVMAWFKFLDEDPIMLLRRLDTEGVPKTSRLTLEHLLRNLDEETLVRMVTKWSNAYLDPSRTPKSDRCSVECVFFWRVIVEYLLKQQNNASREESRKMANSTAAADEENGENEPVTTTSQIAALLEMTTPSVTDYVDFVIQRVDELLLLLREDADYNEDVMEGECVLEHVLMLCDCLDLSDEFGRRRLFEVVRGWLVRPAVPASLTKFLLQIYFNLETNVQSRVLKVTEMTSELLDAAEEEADVKKTQEANEEGSGAAAAAVAPPATTLVHPTPVVASKPLNKARETFIRLKVADLKVKLNELNESLGECIRMKDFERATVLRDECARLEAERSALMHELTGVTVPTTCNQEAPNSSGAAGGSLKPESADDESGMNQDKENNEEDEEDDDSDVVELQGSNLEHVVVANQRKLFARLSGDVILKANKMVVVTIQKSPQLWTLPPSLRSLLPSLILPSVQHSDMAIRCQAILALGLCCTLDLALAKKYLLLFYEVFKMDHSTVRVTAINCLIDIFVVFGIHVFLEEAENLEESDMDISDIVLLKTGTAAAAAPQNPKSASETINLATRLLAPIAELIDNDDADLCTAAGIGLAKLFIFNRLLSGRLVSRLLLLWFNPQTAELASLSQSLGVFITDFGAASLERQACVADAVLPTLSRLLATPADSPLSEVDKGLVLNLLVRMTDAATLFPVALEKLRQLDGEERGETKGLDNPCHDDLAMRLSNRVLNAPQSTEARLYIRMLSQLRLSPGKPQLYRDLLRLIELMLKKADRSSLLSLHRFKKNVKSLLGDHDANATEGVDDTRDKQVENDDGVIVADDDSEKVATDEEEGQPRLLGDQQSPNHTIMTTLAGLSIRASPMTSRLLAFSDDEDEVENQAVDIGKAVEVRPTANRVAKASNIRVEEEGKESGSDEKGVVPTRRRVNRRKTVQTRQTTPVNTGRARVRLASSAVANRETSDREKMPPPSSTVSATRRNTRRTTMTSSVSETEETPRRNVRRRPTPQVSGRTNTRSAGQRRK